MNIYHIICCITLCLISSIIFLVQELDDRGLLDGGGVVPSYYTSLKQKQRRSLELQRRSSRMKSRGNEVCSVQHVVDMYPRLVG